MFIKIFFLTFVYIVFFDTELMYGFFKGFDKYNKPLTKSLLIS